MQSSMDMEGSYWPTTSDMEFQPRIHPSNHNNLQNSGEIVDPWNTSAQQHQQPAIAHLSPSFDMDTSGSYPTPTMSSAMTTNYQTEPSYTYSHFPTNHADNYVYDVQQQHQQQEQQQQSPPAPPAISYSHNRFNLAPLPPSIPANLPANLPHMISEGHRVGLSEPWSEAGMRDMEAFERLCSNTNQFIRMKPRKKTTKPIEGMPPNPSPGATAAPSSSTSSSAAAAINDQSFMTVQTGKIGCSPHVTVPNSMGTRADGEVVKPEYTTSPEPIAPYISPTEQQYPDSVSPAEYSSIMNYSSTSTTTHHQSDKASSGTSNMSSPHSESAGFSPVATSSMSPPLPPMTVPSQSPAASLSPIITTRPAVRHANILPAPSNRSNSSLAIDTGLFRLKRNVSKSLLVGNSPDTPSLDTGYQSGTNSGSSGKSPILNGPVPGNSQARTTTTTISTTESSKSATRSRRSATASGSKSNNPAVTPDPPSAVEHKLTETHSIPTADLDTFFQQSEQGCIGGRRAWMCPKCRKAVRKQDRASHKLSHEGKKRYDCACGKQFGRPQDADRHMREQAPCARCPGKMGRYGKDGLCSACVTEIEQGIGVS